MNAVCGRSGCAHAMQFPCGVWRRLHLEGAPLLCICLVAQGQVLRPPRVHCWSAAFRQLTSALCHVASQKPPAHGEAEANMVGAAAVTYIPASATTCTALCAEQQHAS